MIDAAGLPSTPSPVTMTFRGIGPLFDFGDAPDTYKSLVSDNGPLHTIVDGLRLGSLIDDETEGKPSTNSDGDNLTNLNDEDGVASFPTISGGAVPQTIPSYSVAVNATNTTSSLAYLSGWIDWNTNGLFDNGEMAQTNVPAGTSGPVILTWVNQILNGAKGLTNTHARFRLSTNQTAVTSPLGDAPDGEIEDYQIFFATALPVQLTHFEGRWIEGIGNQLNWTTIWERINDRFEVQSSPDAKGFETIGRIVGQGTTTAAQSYNYVDSQPQADITYYRLKQVDTNGEFTYSPIIVVRRETDPINQQLLIYPNPTTDLLQLRLTNQPSMTSATIYTALGQSVLYLPKVTSTINVKSLASGVYILEVKTASGQVLSQRFIKQ